MGNNGITKTIFAVAGGKGGVGKSIFSVALGTLIARSGRNVTLVDLDLGAANLNTYVGIIKKTPTIADFILKKVPTLDDVLLETSVQNMKLISGADFVPGMANPAHWMKLKIMRHIKSLPTEFVVIDLGAGVHFNTLDFFGMSNHGIVVTAPEPGAVMNAYSFIKGALFRKLQNVFRRHPEIGPILDSETKKSGADEHLTIDGLAEQIRTLAPDMLPLIKEIEKEFCPALVVNRIPEGEQHVLVRNLISLCRNKLGLPVDHLGNLPDSPDLIYYLLKVPDFLNTAAGRPYCNAVQHIADSLLKEASASINPRESKRDFTDREVEDIITLMNTLDDSVFSGSSRDTWRLRMYFKPSDVVSFLISRGVNIDAFHRQS